MNGQVVKRSLPNDINRGNKEDSEAGDDLEVSFDEEPIITYLNDPDCNSPPIIAMNGSLMKMSISIILCVVMM